MKQLTEETITTVADEHELSILEEMGYDVPFVTYTWERWQRMQVSSFLAFTRFQRAVEQHEAQLALAIAMELQEVSISMQKEAMEWVGVPKR